MDLGNLSDFERQALDAIVRGSISLLSPSWVESLRAVGRSKSAFGIYVELALPDDARLVDGHGVAVSDSFECFTQHPNGADAIFCVLYVRDGRPQFLECSSTSEWPEHEQAVRFP